MLLHPRSNNENPLTVAGVGRARDRFIIRNTYDASSNRSTFFVFILHTSRLLTFSLNRAKCEISPNQKENQIWSSFFFFTSVLTTIPSFLFSGIARDFSIQPFIASDVESVRKFVV